MGEDASGVSRLCRYGVGSRRAGALSSPTVIVAVRGGIARLPQCSNGDGTTVLSSSTIVSGLVISPS